MIKEILIFAVLCILVFLFFSGATIRFNPFGITFPHLFTGIGVAFIAIGIGCIMAQSYQNVKEDSGYYKGYKDGCENSSKHMIELLNKKLKELEK